MNHLLENMSRVENESKVMQENQASCEKKESKRVNLNVMRLQDKSFLINKNIYNIAVGQIFSKESYLATLNSKISELKSKILDLEE